MTGAAGAVLKEGPADDAPRRETGWGQVGFLLTSLAVSLTGDQVMFIAVVWSAAKLGGPVAVTWVTLAESVPRAVAMIFGGAVSDSIGPRALLLRTTGARVVILGVAVVVALGTHALVLLVVVALVEGGMLGLGTPPFAVMIPSLVAPASLGRANSIRTMVARIAPIFGSPLGAWLIAGGRLVLALAVVGLGALISFVCLIPATRAVAVARTTPTVPLWRRCGGSFTMLRTDHRLRLLFLSSLCLNFAFAWPMNPGLPVVVIARHWQVSAVGLLVACWAAGALGSAGLSWALGERQPIAVRLVGGGTGMALSLTAMILVPSLLWMAILAAALGVSTGQNAPAAMTLYQQAAPPDQLGAAMAMTSLATIGCAPIAYAVVGALASFTSPFVAWLVSALIAFGGPLIAVMALRMPVTRYRVAEA